MINRQVTVRYLSVFVLLLFQAITSWTQIAVQRSKDKVVIAGIPYYIHSVKKGETVYSISRSYGITAEELTRENPPSLSGLKEGQMLRIPVSMVSSSSVSQPVVNNGTGRDESRFIYHKLQPGETIYFLSKTYSVSGDEIIRSNPGIDINKLPLGSEIAIPKKEFMNVKQRVADQDSQFYYHKVARGETMASIAQKYGLSVRALRRENRDTRFPQVGDYLKIPGMKPDQNKLPKELSADTLLHVTENQVAVSERPSGFTPVTRLKGTIDVAVLLPFYLDENAKRTDIDSTQIIKGKRKEINRSDDWIYPRSSGFIEMYEGILLAADTLRTLGLDIEINTFDIKDDTIELHNLIRSGKLDKMDLIIGPVHSKNLIIAASFAGRRGIPIVSPVQLLNNSVLSNNPSLFMANSSLEVAQNCIAGKTGDFNNDNFLLIHSDSTGSDQDVIKLKTLILNELGSKMPFEEIRLKELIFYSRSAFGNDSINRLSHALSEKTENVVIIASEDIPVISESITEIHTLSRKFNLKVFGYPNMRYLDNLDPKICFDLGLMIYSPYWIDYSKENVKQFISGFRTKFLTQPSEMSYAWQGYDIAYFFISGLAMHGKSFVIHPEIHNPDLLQTQFDFKRKSFSDGFENQKLFLVRYSNNYELELVNETEDFIEK